MILRYAKPWFSRLYLDEQGEGGEGGGGTGGAGGSGGEGGGSADPAMEQLRGEANSLRAKSKQLLDEKKASDTKFNELSATLERLGGTEGIKKLSEFQARLQKDELGQLLADGKTDEWFDRRSEALRRDYKNQSEAMKTELLESTQQRDGLQQELNNLRLQLEGDAAAAKSGVLDEHRDDVALWIKHEFVWSPEHKQPVTKDAEGGVVYGKDGSTPMGVAEWLEGKKETKRSWWAASQGGGATGQGGGGKGVGSLNLDGLSPADFQRQYKKQFGEK